MLIPILVSSVFVLIVVVLCLLRPNAGRIFLGLFFLAMALGVNGNFTFTNPQAYVDYLQGALIPLYRDLAVSVVTLVGPRLFGGLLMAFEIAMGLMLLHKRQAVRLGLIGTALFLISMAPLSLVQLPWLGLLAGEAYLFSQEFNTSLLDALKTKLLPNPAKPV